MGVYGRGGELPNQVGGVGGWSVGRGTHSILEHFSLAVKLGSGVLIKLNTAFQSQTKLNTFLLAVEYGYWD